MNILFLNANLFGHINPTLGLVKNIVSSGHHVDYFCSEPFAKQVTDIGANWIGYSDHLEQFLKQYCPTDRHPFYMLMEYILLYDEVVLPDVLDIVNSSSYDMVICDSIFGSGIFLKDLVSIPVVCSHSSFAMSHAPVPPRMLIPGFHPQLDNCYLILQRICDTYKLEVPTIEQVFTSKLDLNLVYTTPGFNADENVHEPEYLFVGPSLDRVQIGAPVDFSVHNGRKVIYISLGSFNTNFVDFYKSCIEAFSTPDYFVYMSIGNKFDRELLGDIPDNFVVESFLPQLQILEVADVFLTHAGFNSVNEALYCGVPMITLPQLNDQHMVAKRLSSMGLGISENMAELTSSTLLDDVNNLLNNNELKECCSRISAEMKDYVDLDKVVKKLEEYIQE